LSFSNLNSIDLKNDNKILNTNAEKKLVTTKPPTKLAASKIITAFITNKKRPNVTMVAGSVKNINSGLTNMFKIAIAKATQIAEDMFAIATPGKMPAKAKTANAVNKTFSIKFMSNNLI
jgi:transcription initiation factor TFIIIB Brf1 subunit/transcription initiation factor TFIIB